MWFIWIMWVIVALAIIATIILLTGKGSMLVSGFNTKSPEERAKYDKKKVSKQAGSIMVFVDIGLLALTSYIHFRAIPAIQNNTISDYGTEITIVALGICVYIIVIGIWLLCVASRTARMTVQNNDRNMDIVSSMRFQNVSTNTGRYSS